MTSLLFSDKEKSLQLSMIDEAFRLFGIDCTLYDLSSSCMSGLNCLLITISIIIKYSCIAQFIN